MWNWLKDLFNYKHYEYKGSSQELYKEYKKSKLILIQENLTKEEEWEVLGSLQIMIHLMKTVGDGNLVEEIQIRLKNHIDKRNLENG